MCSTVSINDLHDCSPMRRIWLRNGIRSSAVNDCSTMQTRKRLEETPVLRCLTTKLTGRLSEPGENRIYAPYYIKSQNWWIVGLIKHHQQQPCNWLDVILSKVRTAQHITSKDFKSRSNYGLRHSTLRLFKCIIIKKTGCVNFLIQFLIRKIKAAFPAFLLRSTSN